MPITKFLDRFNFDSETKRIMDVAFDIALATLPPADRTDLRKELIANKIIALAVEGLRDPNLLSEWSVE